MSALVPSTSAAALAVKPLIFACKTCHTRFPRRYGWRDHSAINWRAPLFDKGDNLVDKAMAVAVIPIALMMATVWVPMEMMFPPCPMCGHGVIRRDHGHGAA